MTGKYIVELLVCHYEDDTHWRADGHVLAEFERSTDGEAKAEAQAFARSMANIAADMLLLANADKARAAAPEVTDANY